MPKTIPLRNKFREIRKAYFGVLSEEEKKFVRSLEHNIRRHGYDLIQAQEKAKLNRIYSECRKRIRPRFLRGGLCSPR